MLFFFRLHWIQRTMKSIGIFPLLTVSFWSCHNFILQKIAPSHPLRFFHLSDIIPLLLSTPNFLYFFQKILFLCYRILYRKPGQYNCTRQQRTQDVNKRIIFTARGSLHNFLGDTKDPSIPCCPLVLNTTFCAHILNQMLI